MSWSYAVFWAGLTFVTVPYVRIGVAYISENIGAGFFTYTVVALVALATFWALYSIRLRMTISSFLWLTGVAGLIVYLAFGLAGGSPVEAVHYVQYGTLSIFLFRAFSHRVRDPSIYVAAALTGTLAGMVDETIQWLSKDRVFDLRDIWLNFKAATLVQIGLAAGIRPRLISGVPGPTSARRLCLLSALVTGFLGLCLQNTPGRVAAYAPSIPGLGFVNPTQQIMVEYGHLHSDEALVSFRSRLTLDELRQSSLANAEAEMLDLDDIHERDSQDGYDFRELLLSNTYLYEGRLHQIRRDQMLTRAESSDRQEMRAEHFAAARWENEILKDHFFDLLQGTRYEWSPEMENEVGAAANLTKSYQSSISTHLLTTFSPRQMAFLCFGGVAIFLWGAFLCNRAARRNGNA